MTQGQENAKPKLKFQAAWQNPVGTSGNFITTYLIQTDQVMSSGDGIDFAENTIGMYARLGENTKRQCLYDDQGNRRPAGETVHAFEVDADKFLAKYSIEVRLNKEYQKRIKGSEKGGQFEMETVKAGSREEYWIRNNSASELRLLLQVQERMSRVPDAKAEINAQREMAMAEERAKSDDFSGVVTPPVVGTSTIIAPPVVNPEPAKTDAPPF